MRSLRQAATDIRVAAGLLTTIPVGQLDVTVNSPARSVPYFPIVGALIGGASLAVGWVASLLSVPVGSVACLIAGLVLTRGLHWDGLADVSDAWWGGSSPQRRREIMSDTQVGSFATAAVVMVALALYALYGTALEGRVFAAIPLGATAGRMAVIFAAGLGSPAKSNGLGTSMFGGSKIGLVAGAVSAVGIIAGSLLLQGLPLVVVFGCTGASVVLAAVVPHLISERMGGVTGDVFGASVLLVEVVSVAATLAIIQVWG